MTTEHQKQQLALAWGFKAACRKQCDTLGAQGLSCDTHIQFTQSWVKQGKTRLDLPSSYKTRIMRKHTGRQSPQSWICADSSSQCQSCRSQNDIVIILSSPQLRVYHPCVFFTAAELLRIDTHPNADLLNNHPTGREGQVQEAWFDSLRADPDCCPTERAGKRVMGDPEFIHRKLEAHMWSLSVAGRLLAGPLCKPKSTHAHVPHIKWHSIYLSV